MRLPPLNPYGLFRTKAPEPLVIVQKENGRTEMRTLSEARRCMSPNEDKQSGFQNFLDWLKGLIQSL